MSGRLRAPTTLHASNSLRYTNIRGYTYTNINEYPYKANAQNGVGLHAGNIRGT